MTDLEQILSQTESGSLAWTPTKVRMTLVGECGIRNVEVEHVGDRLGAAQVVSHALLKSLEETPDTKVST